MGSSVVEPYVVSAVVSPGVVAAAGVLAETDATSADLLVAIWFASDWICAWSAATDWAG